MSSRLTSPLRVRKATALDRSALSEWVRAFALLIENEAHSSISTGLPRPNRDHLCQVVILCDAVRVAFAEYIPLPTGPSELQIFIKPFAWAHLSHQQIREAVIAHHSANTAPAPSSQRA